MIAIFDTSTCRSLTRNLPWAELPKRVERLRECEYRYSIHGRFSPTVALELAAHIRPSDPEKEECCKALAYLALHTKDQTQKNKVRAINEATNCILLEMFGVKLEKIEWLSESMARLALGLSNKGLDALNATDLELTDQIAQGKAVDESGWVAHFEHISKLHKYATGWQHWAESAVRVYAGMAGVQLTSDELRQKRERFMELFTLPFEYTKLILENQQGVTPKPDRWTNHIWDIQLTFIVGVTHRIDNERLVLVTCDKRLIEAANRAGASEHVVHWNEYSIQIDYKT